MVVIFMHDHTLKAINKGFIVMISCVFFYICIHQIIFILIPGFLYAHIIAYYCNYFPKYRPYSIISANSPVQLQSSYRPFSYSAQSYTHSVWNSRFDKCDDRKCNRRTKNDGFLFGIGSLFIFFSHNPAWLVCSV